MVNLNRDLDEPLSRRFRQVEDAISAAENDLLELYILDVARLVCDPFPEATELVVDVEPSEMSVTIDIISSEQELLWVAKLPGTDLPDYRTGDGATLAQLLEAVETTLEIMLGDRHPEDIWPLTSSPDRYRVPLRHVSVQTNCSPRHPLRRQR